MSDLPKGDPLQEPADARISRGRGLAGLKWRVSVVENERTWNCNGHS